MGISEVSPGSGCFRIELSKTQRNWSTFKTATGVIPVEDLDRGVDVDIFIASVWDALRCHGFMKMTMSLAGFDVVFIESLCDEEGPEVQSVAWSSDQCPGGLVGPWVEGVL